MAQRKHTVRIIGGKWKGRKLKVADRPELRPTMSRVRETLFNWLRLEVPDAHVLDLFAGTGALSFEALSRGASFATLLDRDRVVTNQLRAESRKLGANCEVVTASAPLWLERQSVWPWDIVFLDPPFKSNLLERVLPHLKERRVMVYIEQNRRDFVDDFPGWNTLKLGHAGEVLFRLLRPGLSNDGLQN